MNVYNTAYNDTNLEKSLGYSHMAERQRHSSRGQEVQLRWWRFKDGWVTHSKLQTKEKRRWHRNSREGSIFFCLAAVAPSFYLYRHNEMFLSSKKCCDLNTSTWIRCWKVQIRKTSHSQFRIKIYENLPFVTLITLFPSVCQWHDISLKTSTLSLYIQGQGRHTRTLWKVSIPFPCHLGACIFTLYLRSLCISVSGTLNLDTLWLVKSWPRSSTCICLSWPKMKA